MSETISFIKFKRSGEIGNNEGKNSDVFLAMDEQLGDELVVKRMAKSKFMPDEYFLESKMLYTNKHPNIMEIQYASQDKDYIYLAMPYYKKGSIHSIAKTRYLSVREIIRYSLDLLGGVSFIHSKGLLHLDIKPSNILLDTTGKAVLTDFGLSRYTDENGIANQDYFYSQHAYPELFQSSARTVKSDIYQIGLTMYRLCNGLDVLKSQCETQGIQDVNSLSVAVLNETFPDRSCFLPHIPKKLQNIILKALKVDLDLRYNNTIEIMNDLSVVDSNLDWVFTGQSSLPFYKIVDNFRIEIKVSLANQNIICTKTNLDTGKTNKITRCCISFNQETDDYIETLKNLLKELD